VEYCRYFQLSHVSEFKMSGGFLALQQKKSKEKRKMVDLEDAFKEADKNKDGKLNMEEWCEVLAKTGHDNPRSLKDSIIHIINSCKVLTTVCMVVNIN
jgi:Ca2+-binding EF-hand superfamily protein